MSGWKEVPEPAGNGHAEVRAGAETLEELQTLPVREAALLPIGRESCREFRVPSTDGFWKFSVRTEGKKKMSETDKFSLCFEERHYLKVLAIRCL